MAMWFFIFAVVFVIGLTFQSIAAASVRPQQAALAMPILIVGKLGAIITGAIWAFTACVQYLQASGLI